MRKILLMVALCFAVVATANAQRKFDVTSLNGAVRWSINNDDDGGQGGLDQFGVEAGVTLAWARIKNFELVPSASYYFVHDKMRSWGVDVDAHYNFYVEKSHKLSLYPLAGMSYKIWSRKNTPKKDNKDFYRRQVCNKAGINLGGGVAYQVADSWTIRLEGKYQWFNHTFDQGVLGLGVSYTLK